MKEKYRIKSAARAAAHGFRTGDFSGDDTITEKNQAVLDSLYRRLRNGEVDYYYLSTGNARGGNVYVFSRDTKYSRAGLGVVRVSCFWRNGSGGEAELIPQSHCRFHTLNDYHRYGLPCGWVRVRKNRAV